MSDRVRWCGRCRGGTWGAAALRTGTKGRRGPEPLEELEQSFLALARAAIPLTMSARLVCDEPSEEPWPVLR
ncbi:hypothetical protein [Streptomyces sp. BRA346]|uniref:hypothetical protein n=1 Tax=Streptomyces sp. BRA346 TaxID=2878199 RepID=UPI004064231B